MAVSLFLENVLSGSAYSDLSVRKRLTYDRSVATSSLMMSVRAVVTVFDRLRV